MEGRSVRGPLKSVRHPVPALMRTVTVSVRWKGHGIVTASRRGLRTLRPLHSLGECFRKRRSAGSVRLLSCELCGDVSREIEAFAAALSRLETRVPKLSWHSRQWIVLLHFTLLCERHLTYKPTLRIRNMGTFFLFAKRKTDCKSQKKAHPVAARSTCF